MGWFNLILRTLPETRREIALVQELLREGAPIREALKRAGLGWKNYYKYAPLIYDDPEILIPLRKRFLGDYWCKGVPVEQLRLAFNEVAKHVAEMLVRREVARGSNPEALRNPGKLWLSLSRGLQKKWIREIWLDFLRDWTI
jgi:hypothetical protein